MAYSSLLQGIHSGISDAEAQHAITIDSKTRTFIIPADFNKTIAYEGDINSQIITFSMPESHDNHKLAECEHKKVRWYNVGSGAEGTTKLFENEDKTQLTWEVPPAAFTKAGQLRFSFTFYDIDKENGKVYFSWNSGICSDLLVAATLNNVGIPAETNPTFIPAKDEVLVINDETRTIIAPTGYNNLVCNYGDIGVSTVFFRAKRYIRGIDLMDAKISIIYKYPNGGGTCESIGENSYIKVLPYAEEQEEKNSEQLVTITWTLPKELTANDEKYNGAFGITLNFTEEVEGEITKSWYTNEYAGLIIGKSIQLSSGFEGFGETAILNGNVQSNALAQQINAIYTHAYYDGSRTLKEREIAIETEGGRVLNLVIGGFDEKIPVAAEAIFDGGFAPINHIQTLRSDSYQVSESTEYSLVPLDTDKLDYTVGTIRISGYYELSENHEDLGGVSATILCGIQEKELLYTKGHGDFECEFTINSLDRTAPKIFLYDYYTILTIEEIVFIY